MHGAQGKVNSKRKRDSNWGCPVWEKVGQFTSDEQPEKPDFGQGKSTPGVRSVARGGVIWDKLRLKKG